MISLRLPILLCAMVVLATAEQDHSFLRRVLKKPNNSKVCPDEWPEPGSKCETAPNHKIHGTRCEYGEETCCGETYKSFVCECYEGKFACYYMDACLWPWCERDDPTRVPLDAEPLEEVLDLGGDPLEADPTEETNEAAP